MSAAELRDEARSPFFDVEHDDRRAEGPLWERARNTPESFLARSRAERAYLRDLERVALALNRRGRLSAVAYLARAHRDNAKGEPQW